MKITFAAIVNDTIIGTRSSGTMAYTHALVVDQAADGTQGVVSWHLSREGADRAARKWADRGAHVVDATPIKTQGGLGKNHGEVWQPLWDAAFAYSATDTARKRDAALADAMAEVEAGKSAECVCETQGTQLCEADLHIDGRDSREVAIDASTAAAHPPVDVEEPIVTVTSDGMAEDADGDAITMTVDAAQVADAVDELEARRAAKKPAKRSRKAASATLADKMAAVDAGEPAPVAKPLTANQKKAKLGSMVHDALNKLAAGLTDAELDALQMTADDVAAKMAAWLRYIPAEGHVVP